MDIKQYTREIIKQAAIGTALSKAAPYLTKNTGQFAQKAYKTYGLAGKAQNLVFSRRSPWGKVRKHFGCSGL